MFLSLKLMPPIDFLVYDWFMIEVNKTPLRTTEDTQLLFSQAGTHLYIKVLEFPCNDFLPPNSTNQVNSVDVCFPLKVHSWMYWHGHSLFFFLIIPGTVWMVSEFPFHKPYFPWQEHQAKSFGCFWDIFERCSREQSAATSLLIKAWTSLPTSTMASNHSLYALPLKKKREKKSSL